MPRIRTHPGEILREEYFAPLKMSARELAAAIGVPANRISGIVRERRGVTADAARRLGRYFNTDPTLLAQCAGHPRPLQGRERGGFEQHTQPRRLKVRRGSPA